MTGEGHTFVVGISLMSVVSAICVRENPASVLSKERVKEGCVTTST